MPRTRQLIVVANRLPVRRLARGDNVRWETSPGGLVAALTPLLRRQRGTWVGWAGGPGPPPPPFDHDGTLLSPVGMSRGEIEGFYDGFCNRTLWPLYHDVVRRPEFHRTWWRSYVDINQRYAEAAAATAQRGAMVWVHDYHLQLVPALLRRLRSDLRIGFFLHIPFPPPELFAQLPWRRELTEGLLGADVVGFQTRSDAGNYRESARSFADAEGRGQELAIGGRTVHARAFPISIDVEQFESLAADPEVIKRGDAFRARLGRGRKILLGVDRLDYTKGIDLRLRAFQELLATKRLTMQDVVFVQVAVPSRERVPDYEETRSRIEGMVGRINGEHGLVGMAAVHYLRRSVNPLDLVSLYRVADVMVVTPFRDGMNLVAKEYVASRIDNAGALVLSEFTGAAHELRQALLVNPHDIDGLEQALEDAVHMSDEEASHRMRRLRSALRRHDVHHWAHRFLEALHP